MFRSKTFMDTLIFYLFFIILVMGLEWSNVLEPINLKLLGVLIAWKICNIKYTERTIDRKHFLLKLWLIDSITFDYLLIVLIVFFYID